MSEVASVVNDGFTATAICEGTVITARLEGSADSASVDSLESLLTRIHAAAMRQRVNETVIDLRQLEFMNSTCFKSFVSWVTEVSEVATDRQYAMRFISNPSFHWQKRSLHSLRCFAVELITITEK